jgi:DNA-binding transcriptional MerR regulator
MDRPSTATTLEQIASLTQVPWRELYAATAHRFVDMLVPPGTSTGSLISPSGATVPLLPGWAVWEHFRPVFNGQFCPRCLETSVYHRTAWMPVAVSACLEHHCLLLDHCPACSQPVAVQDIAVGYCARCGLDLTTTRSRSTENDCWGELAQQFIQGWLGLLPLPDEAHSCALPEQPPVMLYSFLDGLRQAITGVSGGWRYLHPLPHDAQFALRDFDDSLPSRIANGLSLSFDIILKPEESYCLFATAFKALVNWPEGFYEFLRAFSLREVQHFEDKLRTDFAKLYSVWLSERWAELSFVQDAFNQHLVDHYALSPSMAQSRRSPSTRTSTWTPTYVTVSDTARLLGVSPKTVNHLVEVGLLFRYAFPECTLFPERLPEAHYDLIRRVEVLELRTRWANGVSLQDTIRWLGLSRHTVLGLVRAELLFAERGPEVDDSKEWTFSKQAVTECYYDVLKPARRSVPPLPSVDLDRAAQILTALEWDETDVLRQVAQGKLPCYLPPSAPGLGKMTFVETDLRVLLDGFKTEKGWVSQREVARRMGVQETSILRWLETGLLSPVTSCDHTFYFEEDAIEQFATDHVFIDEAANLVGVPTDIIRRWTREGLLEPVSGPKVDFYYRNLFRREDVERLHLEGHSD